MDRGQAEFAWGETMVASRPVLEALAGKSLPTYILIPTVGCPDPTRRVAAFLRKWASALDGAEVSLPITGIIGKQTVRKGEHDDG